MSDSSPRVAALDAQVEHRRAGRRSAGHESARRPYSAPMILSREPLEAAANVCDPLFNGKGDMTVCPLGASNS